MGKFLVRSAAVVSGLALACSIAAAFEVPAEAADSCESMNVPVLEAAKPSTGTSLLSRSSAEIDGAEARYGFTQDEGVAFLASTTTGDGLVAAHRMYKGGDFVVAAGQDVASLVDDGYDDQGVKFYVSQASSSCTTGVHTLVKKGFHRQATSASSVSALEADGYTDTGIAFYAVVPGSTRPPEGADADGTFSIAVIPDTQNEVLAASGTNLDKRNAWLAAHKGADDLDLRAALQVGDLTNWDTPDSLQYQVASRGMSVLENAGVPWIGALGNHDAQATGQGGGARPGVSVRTALRDTHTYNTYFPPSRFSLLKGAYEKGKEDTSYHTFEAAGRTWLVLVLEVWPRQDRLDWAEKVVADHPHDNVIVLTHSFLNPNGSVYDGNDGYGASTPAHVWDALKAHPNVQMIFSGHVGFNASTTLKANDGHKVFAALQNYKDYDNYVRLVKIDVNTGTITHSYYAPKSGTNDPSDTELTGFTFVN